MANLLVKNIGVLATAKGTTARKGPEQGAV